MQRHNTATANTYNHVIANPHIYTDVRKHNCKHKQLHIYVFL